MVRLDMSEYMEKHTVSRLVGAPPGYVGYEEGGQLTEAVRRRPYCVLLLDEIEKAHHDVFNVLLQLLEDGRLTDGQGRTVDFKNAVVIMTSNLGSDLIAELPHDPPQRAGSPGAPGDASAASVARVREQVMGLLRQQFRPEFLNRVDEVIVFSRLDQAQLRQIVLIQLRGLSDRLAARKLDLSVSPAAVDLLAEEGYDPTYGARPLKRVIQRRLQDPIAMAILEGKYGEGDTVAVDAARGELTIERAAASVETAPSLP
jgi:ATP-dependent Clp protease ATP-binding subunit ClpB